MVVVYFPANCLLSASEAVVEVVGLAAATVGLMLVVGLATGAGVEVAAMVVRVGVAAVVLGIEVVAAAVVGVEVAVERVVGLVAMVAPVAVARTPVLTVGLLSPHAPSKLVKTTISSSFPLTNAFTPLLNLKRLGLDFVTIYFLLVLGAMLFYISFLSNPLSCHKTAGM